ncbi:L-rhamnose mutarotase [Lachnospira multipara]|uniref:L-rhamnose mutarotase n=1 Tax=Lachnospira multipara TaxID=28051 RepID=UPI0004E0B4B8|nr:L-rhamnose mutarotase [Lachnospira multipara]
MIRKAFKMYLNPRCAKTYEERHQKLWPEMKEVIRSHGGHNYSIFLDEETNVLYGYVEVESEERWEEIANTPINKKWWDYMAPLMKVNADNSPVQDDLKNVFYLS